MHKDLQNAINEFIPDYPIDSDKLQSEFEAWDDLAMNLMIANGLGHLALEELLGREPEMAFIMARIDCGIRLSQDWIEGCDAHRVCDLLDRAAKVCGVFI